MDFAQLGLQASLVEALKKEGIITPTNIQERAIPLIRENKDVIGESETGTGKTLAYLLPIFEKVDPSRREPQVIILTPTHELAIQVQREVELLATNSGIEVNSTPIIGNVNIKRQIDQLKAKPQVVVGSPGRILELIKKKKIKAHTVKTIVLDEADRLLDKHNRQEIEAVIKTTQRDRQLLLFSATIPEDIIAIGHKIMKEPEVLQVQSEVPVPEGIEHMYFLTESRDKLTVFRKVYGIMEPEKAILFINRSFEIEKTVSKLKFHGLNVDGIHGTSVKHDRKKVMDDFRAGRTTILVASDLAARGLDIEGVTHIFNLDLPEDPKFYLHRAGRTGRAGKSGYTVSIVNDYEQRWLRKYEKEYGLTIPMKDMYKGKVVDARPDSGDSRTKSRSEKSSSQPRKKAHK